MADQEPAAGSNGSGNGENEAQVSVLAQYVKDLSVENPSAPQVFQWQVQPTLDVQFNINVEKAADDVHEVTLKIDVGLRNVPEEALPPFLLIEAPRLLFPFARQIVAEAVTNLGFPPLLLDPIDFAAAYLAQAQAAQEQAAVEGADGGGEPAPSEA
jgi:preprotein translocase subunit SecB